MLLNKSKIVIVPILMLLTSPARPGDITAPERLKADFHMTRTLRQLKDAVHSKGKLVMGGPGLLRWETLSPARSVLVINRQKGWLHYPDLKVTKAFDVSLDPVMKLLSEHLLALTGGDLGALSSMYDIRETGEKTKELTPKGEALRKLFEKMRVSTDDQGRVSKVALISKNRDTTTIVFTKVESNPKIPSGTFERPGTR
jgi:outer membrane lipoprotein-sorting protein